METSMIGRTYECALLDRLMHSDESEFAIIYGRRRVGKTFLVNRYFGNDFAFKFTGIYKEKSAIVLERFATAISEYSGECHDTPANWYKAFDLLKTYLLNIAGNGRKKVVFIDEMPWLDTRGSNFLPALESFWNGWASAESDIVLIACGSATSWITKKLLGDKGGLFNRSTSRIFVRPFTLSETEQYLMKRGFTWTRYDIAECYMIMGGIPFYLRQLSPDMSLAQNIDNIFFRQKGLLWDEFSHLYSTLFNSAESHIAVVKAISKKKTGLTRNEIIEETGLPDNGILGRILDDLVDNEFIRAYNYFGNKKRGTVYQVSDFYTMVHFTYLEGNYGKDPNFWMTGQDLPARRVWAGYAFEMLCISHIEQIRKSLGISGVISEVSTWYSRGEKGAQIDLLIDRRDRVINICEMKFSVGEFEIDKEYCRKLMNKTEVFRSESKTRKALQTTLVTTYGLKRNMYSNRIQSQVTLDDLFMP